MLPSPEVNQFTGESNFSVEIGQACNTVQPKLKILHFRSVPKSIFIYDEHDLNRLPGLAPDKATLLQSTAQPLKFCVDRYTFNYDIVSNFRTQRYHDWAQRSRCIQEYEIIELKIFIPFFQ